MSSNSSNIAAVAAVAATIPGTVIWPILEVIILAVVSVSAVALGCVVRNPVKTD